MRKTRNLIAALLLAVSSIALAADDKEAAPQPTAEQAAQPAPAAEPGAMSRVLDYATSLAGIGYRFGGRSPETGFDCSGYVGYVYKQAGGLSLPRTAVSISRMGEKISRSELKPGDLVFFKTLRRTISHVGIYLGDHRFIHASSTRTGLVEVSDLRERYWANKFSTARRLDVSSEDGTSSRAQDDISPLR
jgi:cell wall-associated NlpC family hydrolase